MKEDDIICCDHRHQKKYVCRDEEYSLSPDDERLHV